MTKDEALRLAVEALEKSEPNKRKGDDDYREIGWMEHREAITASKAALEAKGEPVQVSPLQFVEMAMEKEDCVGKPIIWAEWPNKENK